MNQKSMTWTRFGLLQLWLNRVKKQYKKHAVSVLSSFRTLTMSEINCVSEIDEKTSLEINYLFRFGHSDMSETISMSEIEKKYLKSIAWRFRTSVFGYNYVSEGEGETLSFPPTPLTY